LFYFWQQADAFWEYIWAVFPKAILWPAFMGPRPSTWCNSTASS